MSTQNIFLTGLSAQPVARTWMMQRRRWCSTLQAKDTNSQNRWLMKGPTRELVQTVILVTKIFMRMTLFIPLFPIYGDSSLLILLPQHPTQKTPAPSYCKLNAHECSLVDEQVHKNRKLSNHWVNCQWKVTTESEWTYTFDCLWPKKGSALYKKAENYKNSTYLLIEQPSCLTVMKILYLLFERQLGRSLICYSGCLMHKPTIYGIQNLL